MKILLAAFFLTGGLALAQTPALTPDTQEVQTGARTSTAPAQSTVKPQTIRGCLSSAADNYTVTDQVSGKTFKLEGSTDRLKQFIGQTVEITGSVKSVDGESKPANASTGDILTLADVKQVSEKCSNVPQSGSLHRASPVLLALMQQPVNEDANTQLNSSAQMSSNVQETSAAAADTRSVTTNTELHSVMNVSGHTGAGGFAATTADTTTVGQSTPPTNAPNGYHRQHANEKGISPLNASDQQAKKDTNKTEPVSNAGAIGASEADGNKAGELAGRAEMQTDAKGDKTTYSTMPASEANGTAKANPKINNAPNPDVKKQTATQQPK
jgi:hypothetical protein